MEEEEEEAAAAAAAEVEAAAGVAVARSSPRPPEQYSGSYRPISHNPERAEEDTSAASHALPEIEGGFALSSLCATQRKYEIFRMARRKKTTKEAQENQDPITHTPGAHPAGVGAGAAGGGAAGAAIGGAVGGPIGAVVGAAVGAVAGGLGGKAAAESVNPTVEDTWWRDNYAGRPYVTKGASYDTYRTAYQYGWQARMMHPDREWMDIEPTLGEGWMQSRGDSKLEWADARHAAKDAWDRIGPPIGKDVLRDDVH